MMMLVIVMILMMFFPDYSIAWLLHCRPHLSSWFLQYPFVFVNT